MEKFFSKVFKENLLNAEFAELLDFLITDNSELFETWSSSKIGKYTSAIKNKFFFDKKRFEYVNVSNLNSVLKSSNIKQKSEHCIAVFSKYETSQARDLLRHIRNGICHQNISLYKKRNNSKMFEIFDFNNKGKKKHQTAYMTLSLDFLLALKATYDDINSQKFKPAKKKRQK